jgi:hypothetical protein
MKKVEILTINNSYEEWELAFDAFLKERFSRSSIAKLKQSKDSMELLKWAFFAWWRLGTKRILDEVSKYNVYEK